MALGSDGGATTAEAGDAAAAATEWVYTYDPRADKCPPSKIDVVGAEAVRADFEDRSVSPFVTRTGIASVDGTTSASGGSSLRVLNPTVGGTMQVDLRPPANQTFDIGRYPILAFDYRVPPSVQIDLALLKGTRLYHARFTDRDAYTKRYTRVGEVIADGQWHHAELNLRRVLDGYDYCPNAHLVNQVRFGDWGYHGNGPRMAYHLDNVRLLPTVSGTSGFEVELRGTDAGGIKGFSFNWSGRPGGSPDTKIDAAPGKHIFKNIPEGRQYLHLRACDNAGNWTEPRYFSFLVDNTPPTVRGLGVTDAALVLSVSDALSDIDPQSVRVKVNGTELPLNAVVTRRVAPKQDKKVVATKEEAVQPPGPEYPPRPESFEWEWALARGPVDGPVPNGTKVGFEVKPIRDFAGNQAPGKRISWVVDYTKDKTPPPGPEVSQPFPAQEEPGKLLSRPVLETFTTSLGEWDSLNEVGGGIPKRVRDPERQDYVLSITNTSRGDMGTRMLETDYDAARFPLIGFDYKLPKKGYAFSFHLAAYVNGKWRVLELYRPLRSTRTERRLRKVADAVRDGKWHVLTVNLHELLREEDPGQSKYIVQRLAIVDWYSSRVPAGCVYYIDNFAVRPLGDSTPEFEFHAADASGIGAFSYEISRLAEVTPDEAPEATGTTAKFSGLAPGLWYFHVRAQDGAGNWGPASRVPHVAVGRITPGQKLRMMGFLGPWSRVHPMVSKLPRRVTNAVVTDTINSGVLTYLRRVQASPFLEFTLSEPSSLVSRYPALRPLGPDGNPLPAGTYDSLCPTGKDPPERRLSLLRATLKKSEVVGVLLRGVQFPCNLLTPKPSLTPSCFSESCLARFQKDTRLKVPGETTADRAKWILAEKRKEWVEWKCSVVTELVRQAKQVIDEERPGVLLGLAISPWQEGEHQGAIRSLAGQDVVRLAKHADFLVPMTLHAACGRKPDWAARRFQQLRDALKSAKARAWVWPLIQAGRVTRTDPRIDPEEVAVALAQAVGAGAGEPLVWIGSADAPDAGLRASLEAVYGEMWRLGRVTSAVQSQPSTVTKQARKLLDSSKAEQALGTLKKALAAEPNDPLSWALLGEGHAQLGQIQQALSATQRAVFEDPFDARWYDRLGRILKESGRYDEAIELLKHALELDPELAPANYQLAAAYMLKGKAPAAFDPLQQACKLDPDLRKAWPEDPVFKPVWDDQWFSRLK